LLRLREPAHPGVAGPALPPARVQAGGGAGGAGRRSGGRRPALRRSPYLLRDTQQMNQMECRPHIFEVRADEPGYAKLWDRDTQATSRYGTRIDLTPEAGESVGDS